MKSQYSLTSEENTMLVMKASKIYNSHIDLNILNSLLGMVYGTLDQPEIRPVSCTGRARSTNMLPTR